MRMALRHPIFKTVIVRLALAEPAAVAAGSVSQNQHRISQAVPCIDAPSGYRRWFCSASRIHLYYKATSK